MSKEFMAGLEALGEDAVRAKLAKGGYGSRGHERQMVIDWLELKAQARSSDSSLLQIRMARSAKNAAWIAAIAAIIAAICAVIALYPLIKQIWPT